MRLNFFSKHDVAMHQYHVEIISGDNTLVHETIAQ